jgi:hypothetical protein
MFADDIFTKPRTLIDAKETSYATGNTFNHQNDNAQSARQSQFLAEVQTLRSDLG